MTPPSTSSPSSSGPPLGDDQTNIHGTVVAVTQAGMFTDASRCQPEKQPAKRMKAAQIGVVAAVLTVVAAACGPGSDGQAGEPAPTTTSQPPATSAVGSLPEGPSALEDQFNQTFPDPLVDPEEIVPGGPPPDGIPPIDDPKFVTVDEADEWLNDPEPVLVVDIGGDVRAYPIQILMWHEIVNDTVGGVPVSVTYCPLCNSAITFQRTVRGVETTFGTSGRLYFANLVMYDRATESLWNQLDGRAVVGVLTGEQLDLIPSGMVAWGDFKESKPDARVLDKNRTGAQRAYGTNPYTGLDDPDGQPFLFRGDVDVRAKAMQRVVAMEKGGDAVAWTLDSLREDEDTATVTVGEFAGEPIVIFWKPGQASALETSSVASGREVGTVGVFSPVVDDQTLTFQAEGDSFIDEETGSTWNILGEATDGPLTGETLEPITHLRTFWFSWSTFRPDTELIDERP